MICENPGCHCQVESGVVRDGQFVCSAVCAPNMTGIDDLCPCGHQGCGSGEIASSGLFGSLEGATLYARA